jgi:hypothetical protein
VEQPEFQKALTIVLVAGFLVIGVGTTALAFAFRAAKGHRPMHPGLIAFVVIFVFICCGILFALAYR